MSDKSRIAPKAIGGKQVGPVGYGLLGLSLPWAPIDLPTVIEALKSALNHGANFWDGGLHYGTPEANSLHLIKHYFQQYPEDASKVVLSIKGAYTHETGPDGTPEGIRAAVEEAIRILPPSVKTIDVFQCSRVDPRVPIETSIEALAELVKEGKIGGIGLSEVSEKSIRRALAVHPIAAVEIELSIFTPDPLHNGIADACHELSIPIAAYSPVSRGFLTGQIRKREDMAENDYRRMLSRFQGDNFDKNMKLVEAVEQIAHRKGVTLAQVAIGWVCSQGAIPIPGSSKKARIIENCGATPLSNEELAEIKKIMDTIPVSGQRYGGQFESALNG